MDIKEILELTEKSYSSEDIKYKNKVYFISYFLSSLVFVLVHVAIVNESINVFFAVPLLTIIGGILIIRQEKMYKKFKSYFDKIFERIVVYGMLAIVISTIIALNVYPKIMGIVVAVMFGFLLSIEGVLFKSRKRQFLGILIMLSSIPMIIYYNCQFLILALVQFLAAICFLINAKKE
ncbi:hypothetical protein [Methanotorris formicicus]|uniref:Uncharacterized protein n=1 Tax=Methanotorris formicicus Mc-S-70 TaxID=647171 RepID=H1L156_9EURY|nr:hypothetical protein [Methanotorris formicicus]EHP84033.1 hypothetical protein MetfoDRAFT_1780 [Methanotorris formicicus Mc-S-70]